MKKTPWLPLCAFFLLACSDDDTTINDHDAATSAEKTTANDPNQSYLGAAAIGVSDLETSHAFYTSVMGLTLRYELPDQDGVKQHVLYFKGATQGGDVILMGYSDGKDHKFKSNPVRLVFYVPDVTKIIEDIRGRGLPIISEPHPEPTFHDAIIGLGSDPDGYMLELIEDKALPSPYLTALGVGVSDLDQAKSFYTETLGMAVMGDITHVTGVWDEWILQYPSNKGSALVIMHYVDGNDHDYKDLPVKSLHYVGNARDLTTKLKAQGLTVISEPKVEDLHDTKALVGVTTDHDGYHLEFVTPQ